MYGWEYIKTDFSKALLVLTFICFYSTSSFSAEPPPKFADAFKDSEEVKTTKSEEELKKDLEKRSIKKNVEASGLVGASSDSRTVDQLKALIKGYAFVIKSKKSLAEKNKLRIGVASSALALSRKIRIEAKDKPGEINKDAERFSKMAIKYIEDVLSDEKNAGKANVSRAAFLGGVANVEIDNQERARELFEKSIHLDPGQEAAPGMAIFVGENYFEESKFELAVSYYKLFLERLSESQEVLARYKLAWSYLNLNDFENAESFFLGLVLDEKSGDYGKDSLVDLAYAVTLHRDEEGVLSLAETQLNGDVDKIRIFLFRAYMYFQVKDGSKRWSKILAKLLEIEKDPQKRLRIVMEPLKVRIKDFASTEPMIDFDFLEKFVREEKYDFKKEKMSDLATELDIQLQKLIKVYLDAHYKKVKIEKSITPQFLVASLLKIANFHIDYLVNSPKKYNVYDLWLGICRENKDHKCLFAVSDRALKNEDLEKRRESYLLENITALDQILLANQSLGLPIEEKKSVNIVKEDGKKEVPDTDETKSNKKKEDESTIKKSPEQALFQKRLIEFVSDYKASKNWIVILKKYVALLIADKKFEKVIPYLKDILKAEKNSENLYRLQWARFEAKQYKDIVSFNGKIPDDKFGKDIKKIIRESHLILATQSISASEGEGEAALDEEDPPEEMDELDREFGEDFKTSRKKKGSTKRDREIAKLLEFEKHISNFIKMDPGGQKSAIAIADFLNRSFELELYKKFYEWLSKVDKINYLKEPNRPIVKKALSYHFNRGEFTKVQDLLRNVAIPSTETEIKTMLVLSNMGQDSRYDLNKLNSLNSSAEIKTRDYLFGLVSLVQPKRYLNYFNKKKKSLKKEKEFALFAYQVHFGRWDIVINKARRAKLGEVIPKELLGFQPTMSEKLAKGLRFPASQSSAASLSKKLPRLLKKVRKIREKVIPDIKGKLPRYQLRVVDSAIAMEAKVADIIMGSKTPKGLDPEQVKEYKAGLEQIAKEFVDQAEEFKKVKETIAEQAEKNIERNKFKKIKLSGKKWPWPKTEQGKLLRGLYKKGNVIGALILLDVWKKNGEIEAKDYHLFKSRLVYTKNSNKFIVDYINEGLKSAKQEELASTWQSTFGLE